MNAWLLILGAVGSLVLLGAVQEWFRKEFLRRRDPARLDGRWHALWGPDERALIAHALLHRDPDPGLERIRRVALTLVVVGIAMFVVFGFLSMNRPLT